MRIHYVLRLLLTICLLTLFSGCTTKENPTNDDVTGSTPSEIETSVTPRDTDQPPESSTGNAGSADTSSDLLPDETNDTVEVIKDPPVTEPQTEMNIEPGTDRMWQNAPTKEEIEYATTVKKPESDTPRANSSGGNGEPLFDDSGITTARPRTD